MFFFHISTTIYKGNLFGFSVHYNTKSERFCIKKTETALFIKLIMSVLVVSKQKKDTSPIRCTRLSFMGSKITKISVTNDKISGRGGLR
jgi:hypothetical protein